MAPDFLKQLGVGHFSRCMYLKHWIETELSWLSGKWSSHLPPIVSTQTGAKGNYISKNVMPFLDFEIDIQDPSQKGGRHLVACWGFEDIPILTTRGPVHTSPFQNGKRIPY